MYSLTDAAARLQAECQAILLFELTATEPALLDPPDLTDASARDDLVARLSVAERAHAAAIERLVAMDIHDEFVRFMNQPHLLVDMTDARFDRLRAVHVDHADELAEAREAARRHGSD